MFSLASANQFFPLPWQDSWPRKCREPAFCSKSSILQCLYSPEGWSEINLRSENNDQKRFAVSVPSLVSFLYEIAKDSSLEVWFTVFFTMHHNICLLSSFHLDQYTSFKSWVVKRKTVDSCLSASCMSNKIPKKRRRKCHGKCISIPWKSFAVRNLPAVVHGSWNHCWRGGATCYCQRKGQLLFRTYRGHCKKKKKKVVSSTALTFASV